MTQFKGIFWFEWLFMALLGLALCWLYSNTNAFITAYSMLDNSKTEALAPPPQFTVANQQLGDQMMATLIPELNAAERSVIEPLAEVSHELPVQTPVEPLLAAAPVVVELPPITVQATPASPKRKAVAARRAVVPPAPAADDPDGTDLDKLAHRMRAHYCTAQYGKGQCPAA